MKQKGKKRSVSINKPLGGDWCDILLEFLFGSAVSADGRARPARRPRGQRRVGGAALLVPGGAAAALVVLVVVVFVVLVFLVVCEVGGGTRGRGPGRGGERRRRDERRGVQRVAAGQSSLDDGAQAEEFALELAVLDLEGFHEEGLAGPGALGGFAADSFFVCLRVGEKRGERNEEEKQPLSTTNGLLGGLSGLGRESLTDDAS